MADNDGNSEARIGWGTLFRLAGANQTLVELDEVTAVELPNEQTDDVEVTHMKSPGKRKEYRGGLIDPGSGSITVNYLPGSDTDLLIREAQNAGTARAFQCDLPDEEGNPEWRVSGFLIVKGRSRAIPIGDRMTMQVAVRYTGNSTEADVPSGGGG
jgi:hypothetical protein